MTRRSCNVLVIGGGLAGIQAAEVAAQFVSDVLLVDRGAIGEAAATGRDASVLAAYLAQDAGGVSDWKSSRVSLGVGAIPGSPRDSTALRRGFDAYLRDIVSVGGDLSDPVLADFTAAGVYNRIGWLESYGLHVIRDAAGTYRGFPSPGHGLNRVLLIEESPREVIERIRKSASVFGVTWAEGVYVTRLFLDGERVAGVYALDVRSGQPVVIESSAIILAAGGADRLYTAEASGTTGAGYALALEAGAEVANMEFVAFGPETTGAPEIPGALLMVLVGLGAWLEHRDGSREAAEIRSPAQLARALARGTGTQGMWLRVPPDVRSAIADVRPFGPSLSALEHPVQIRVGCVGLLGGVVHRAFTTGVEGLFVAGALATGCHGADLLLGVETSFTLYSAENAATAAATHWSRTKPAHLAEQAVRAEERRLAAMRARPKRLDERGRVTLEDAIRRIVWEHAGPHRTGPGLSQALSSFRGLQQELDAIGADTGAELVALCELDTLVRTGELMCEAGLAREETRGQHARADFPTADDARGRNWISVARRSGNLVWNRVPVPA